MDPTQAALRCALAGAAVLAVLLEPGLRPVVAAAAEVTTCGQTVSGKGIFTQDLDCTGFGGDAVTLSAGASLDLAGFTLTGGTGDAVGCEGVCTVRSSAATKGTIENAGGAGVSSKAIVGLSHKVRVKVRNMRITGNGGDGVGAGVCCSPEKVVVLDSEITGNADTGVGAIGKAVIRRSVISSNGSGVSSGRVSMADSVSDGNTTFGVFSGLFGLRARDTNANGNGTYGFSSLAVSGGVRLKNCEAVGNTEDGLYLSGLSGVRVGISGGSFSSNGRDGIHFDDGGFMTDVDARITKATISGNSANGVLVGPDEPLDSMRLRTVTADGNGEAGITGAFPIKGLDLRGSTLTGNGTFGLRHLAPTGAPAGPCPVSASGSTVTGNGIDADCGVSISCADVAACESPDLAADVACASSYDTASGFPGSTWGVCSAD